MSVRLIIFIVVLSFVSYARLEIQFKLSPEAQCVLDKASDIPDDIYFRNLFVTHQDGKTPFTKFLQDYLIVSEYLYRLFNNKGIDMDFDDRMPAIIKTALFYDDIDQLVSSDYLKILDDMFFYYVIRHHSIMQRCFIQCYSQEHLEKTHAYTSSLVLETCVISNYLMNTVTSDKDVTVLSSDGKSRVTDSSRVIKYNEIINLIETISSYVIEHGLSHETIQNQELTNIQQSLKKAITLMTDLEKS